MLWENENGVLCIFFCDQDCKAGGMSTLPAPFEVVDVSVFENVFFFLIGLSVIPSASNVCEE